MMSIKLGFKIMSVSNGQLQWTWEGCHLENHLRPWWIWLNWKRRKNPSPWNIDDHSVKNVSSIVQVWVLCCSGHAALGLARETRPDILVHPVTPNRGVQDIQYCLLIFLARPGFLGPEWNQHRLCSCCFLFWMQNVYLLKVIFLFQENLLCRKFNCGYGWSYIRRFKLIYTQYIHVYHHKPSFVLLFRNKAHEKDSTKELHFFQQANTMEENIIFNIAKSNYLSIVVF